MMLMLEIPQFDKMFAYIGAVVILATFVETSVVPFNVDLEPCTEIGQLIPDSTNCSRFYECSQGGWIRLFCYPGLQFNPETLKCDYKENVQCATEIDLKDFTYEPCQQVDQLKPDTKNCSRFFECTLAGWVGEACNPGLEFNPETLRCDYPQNVKCATESSENLMYEPCQQVDQLKPDTKNCSRFFECTLAGWVGEACNPGLEFNPETLYCDYPQNVKCATETRGDEIEEPSCSALNYGELLPDLTDCNKFLQCSPIGLVPLACPSGLMFNRQTQLCDYSFNVKC